MSPDRGDGGKFSSRITDSDVLRALRAHDDPVATAVELADVLGVSSETVRRQLTELHGRELVGRKQVGARAVVWWLAVEDRQPGRRTDDPLFDLPTFSGDGPTDVSAAVDEHLAAAIAREGTDGDA